MTTSEIADLLTRARTAANALRVVGGQQRQQAIAKMSEALKQNRALILEENTKDVSDAADRGLAEPVIKRLKITEKVFNYMCDRLTGVASLPDPVGRILNGHIRPNGLRVERISVPIGVVGIIYEARPNVTTDAAAVCIKSGNAVILRGGSEAVRTNRVLAKAMASALTPAGLPADAVQLVSTVDRLAVQEMLEATGQIDVLIPRGGRELINEVTARSRVPVIKHYEGLCHLYLAEDAPTERAVAISVNSKCERVEVCNALETLLVDVRSSQRLLPALARAFAEAGIELRGCQRSREVVPEMKSATEDDWHTEYLAPILSVRVVDDVEAAMAHIRHYGSGHTDGIVTQSMELAERFVAGVDSASVLVNASTRLSGGGDYGLGAVVGISTDKLHARGPVGPEELTSYKWVARGDGHLRA